jgi:ubiquitin C-terminal hydrolase
LATAWLSRICACPQVLILHLKRFEFDLSTNGRRKIDEQFSFLFSFYIAAATDTPDVSQPYDLTGVVVHASSAQGGRCYSHIRVGEGA